MGLDPARDTTVFERLRAAASDPEITRCIKAIELVVGYRIPPEHFESISRFETFIAVRQPKYITAWRADPKLEQKWYRAHVGGLGSVFRALAAAHYHAERLGELEATVTEMLEASSFKECLSPTMSLGPGGNDKIDFEYQAFVLAYRRCLDYLAGAVASYFKVEANSFRTLPKSIAKGKPTEVAEAISKAHARHVEPLGFVLAKGRKSVRNRIAHYEFVSAGDINLTARGFFLLGGGEELSIFETSISNRLAKALASRLERLHSCVDDIIDTFVEAAREHDSKSTISR
jgi:hypothetical protein